MEIISLANSLGSAIINAGTARYMSRFMRSDIGQERYLLRAEEALDKYKELRSLVDQSAPTSALVDRIGLELVAVSNLLASSDFTKKERMSFDDIQDLMAKRKRLETLIGVMIADSEMLVKCEQQNRQSLPLNQDKFKRIVNQVLFAWVATDLLMALLLMAFFGSNITSRLNVLLANSKRVVLEKELNPVVPGSDEIARLDAAFHDMDSKLAASRATERAIMHKLLMSDNMNVRLASPCCTTPKISSAGF